MRRLQAIDARVGDRVRRLREANGLTREQLAERAGRSASFVAKLELGTGRGRLETWDLMAKALGTTLAELFVEEPLPRAAGAREAGTVRFGATDEQLAALALHARALDATALAALVTIARQLADPSRRPRS